MKTAVVSGGFDDLRSAHIRFLDEASKHGELHVGLWSDSLIEKITGSPPAFSMAERQYLLQALRYVKSVHPIYSITDVDLPPLISDIHTDTWVVNKAHDNNRRREASIKNNLEYAVIDPFLLSRFPKGQAKSTIKPSHKLKVAVSGCFDWFHSGHVRFFEDVSGYGNLYVVVGSDQNVRLLKGNNHPMFSQDERRYVVQSVRFVHQALISTGSGWLDAEPEINRIRPHVFAVNEDGDKPEKREFCERTGIRYLVLKRTPKPGLPKRQSVDLRGF